MIGDLWACHGGSASLVTAQFHKKRGGKVIITVVNLYGDEACLLAGNPKNAPTEN